MLTDVQTPFLGTPLVPLKGRLSTRTQHTYCDVCMTYSVCIQCNITNTQCIRCVACVVCVVCVVCRSCVFCTVCMTCAVWMVFIDLHGRSHDIRWYQVIDAMWNVTSCSVKHMDVLLCDAMSNQTNYCHITLRHTRPQYGTVGHWTAWHDMTWYVTECDAASCKCNVKSGQAKAGQGRARQGKARRGMSCYVMSCHVMSWDVVLYRVVWVCCQQLRSQQTTCSTQTCWISVLVKHHSFYASLCPAVLRRKLQSSHWFGAPKAYIPTGILLRTCYFLQTPVCVCIYIYIYI